MSQDVELVCRCGQVSGSLRGVSSNRVNRCICYCDDCQAYLHYLGRASLLDPQGGSDIVQVAPNSVSFASGLESIVAMRLTGKGMFRWYASCCKTPLGNTVAPAIPFIGMLPEVFVGAPSAAERDAIFGKVRGGVMGKFAIGGAPKGTTGIPFGIIAHAVPLLLGWKFSGKTWPHPFFDKETGSPRYPVTTITHEEREALRGR